MKRLRNGLAPGSLLLAAALAASAPFVVPSATLAFEAPDFRTRLFDADGVFLAEDDRSSVLEALAAITSNFPDQPMVDDDLRQKALALALQLDPLHYHSRLALKELLKGESPSPTSSFKDLASVSETLWSVGRRLAEPPADPEERRLAPLLLELSLVVHPNPPEERLVAFAEASGGKPVPWGQTVSLRDDSRSTSRALFLQREARDLPRERKPSSTAPSTTMATTETSPQRPENTATPDPSSSPDLPPRPGREMFEPLVAALPAVQWVEGIESGPVAGIVSLTLRPPRNSREREWFATETESGNALPTLPSDEEVPITEPIAPPALVASRGWKWPALGLGEMRFSATGELPGPRRLLRTRATLPFALLYESLASGRPVGEAFALAGDLDAETLEIHPRGDVVSVVESSTGLGKPYLLLPHTVLEPLVEELQRTDRLELLFPVELVSYTDWETAAERMLSAPDPALASASGIFDEIEAASARLPLPELARNPAAQERLEALLTAYPDHLSGRAMLEYGRRPLAPELQIARFMNRVETLVAPFRLLADNEPAPDDTLVEEDDFTDNLASLADGLEATKAQFVELRRDVPPEARALLTSAENLVAAATLYLQLSNRGSTMGEQRLLETREAISAYEEQRAKL